MDILLKLIRWVVGLLVLFIGLGVLFSGDIGAAALMLAGGLLLLPPVGAWAGRSVSSLAQHGTAIAVSLVLFLGGAAWATISHDPGPAPTPQVEIAKTATLAPTPKPARPAEPPKPVDIQSKISPEAVWLIEGAGWDKTRAEWGSAAIKRINRAMPKAAEKVARSPTCDYVETVGLSDRSKPRSMAVFYVDCRNRQRFYVSEDDLKSSAAAVSKNSKTAAISDSAAIEACEQSVKSQLNYPLSFNRDILNTSVYRAPWGNLAVDFTFQAKNAFGAELPQRARCVIDDTGIHPAEISNG